MLNIFFDMDYTILEIDYGTLRPGVKQLFEGLRTDGHTLYIWSAMGARPEEVRALGLEDMVSGVFDKPWENYERSLRGMLTRKEIPVRPDLVVDDTAAIVRAFGGIVVQQYGALSADAVAARTGGAAATGPANDQEMERVYRIIHEYTVNGYSRHPAFRHLSPRAQRTGG